MAVNIPIYAIGKKKTEKKKTFSGFLFPIASIGKVSVMIILHFENKL